MAIKSKAKDTLIVVSKPAPHKSPPKVLQSKSVGVRATFCIALDLLIALATNGDLGIFA